MENVYQVPEEINGLTRAGDELVRKLEEIRGLIGHVTDHRRTARVAAAMSCSASPLSDALDEVDQAIQDWRDELHRIECKDRDR